jgi:hypothetical protein
MKINATVMDPWHLDARTTADVAGAFDDLAERV